MQPSLVPAAAALLLALLTTATATVAVNTSTPCATASCGNLAVPAWNTSNLCAPASCGSLSISYPFWLDGTHPQECGHNAFRVVCDESMVSLANSFMKYQILDIFYPNNSFRVINVALTSSNGTCGRDTFFDISSDLGLSPFKISPKNQELFFLYNCDPREREVPRSWTRVPCSTPNVSSAFALLWKEYAPYGVGMSPLLNCNMSMIPVLGYEGATGADYQRLMKGGFLLEYTDGGACAACTDTGGQCRVGVSDDAFACYCSDGGDGWFICREYVYGHDMI